MAWASDATSKVDLKTAGLTNPETWSHTCSGSDRLLIVQLNNFSVTVTGVTYNGVAMTQLPTFSPQTRGGSVFNYFYLINPDTGSNTVSVSFSATPSQFGSCAASYTGIDQTPIIHDSDGYNFNASTGQLSFTGLTVGDLIVAGVSGQNGGSAMAAGAGTTLRIKQAGANQQVGIFDLSAAAASDTVDASLTADNYGMMGAVFAEAGGGGAAPTSNFLLMGVS